MELVVNGRRHKVAAGPLTPLIEVLREELGLTGTKLACGEGRCGACTVLVDDASAVACLLPVGLVQGRDVTTVEGLAERDGSLSPLQAALLEAGGLQCGACTPGVLISLTALLKRSPDPTEAEVRAAIAAPLCRCTGYHKIVEAARAVAGREVAAG
jgi:aerobic-type carbon monoxide dehydrogenase small subunit (CoxS/CutS family)